MVFFIGTSLSEPRWVFGFVSALQKLEESDRRAQHTMDQLQREQRYLRRRLEQLGVERIRTDSTGSNLSSEKSDSDQGGLSERMRGERGAGAGSFAPPATTGTFAGFGSGGRPAGGETGDKFQKLIPGFRK